MYNKGKVQTCHELHTISTDNGCEHKFEPTVLTMKGKSKD